MHKSGAHRRRSLVAGPFARLKRGLCVSAVACAVLAGCAETPLPVTTAEREIAIQRARFLFEAACVSNTTRRGQEQALDGQRLPSKITSPGRISYADPGALVFAGLINESFDQENDDVSDLPGWGPS